MMKLLVLTLIAIVGFSTFSYAVPEYIPVVSGRFALGQSFFEGQESSLGGNAEITFVPAVRFNNKFSLIPSVDSEYHGTQSAEELAGGNTLFQDTWENGIGLKAVHGLSEHWKLKERFGARMKWFRETTDETWNNGLYDYRTVTLGAELDYIWNKKTSLGLSTDFSYLQFPNYQSLEATSPEAPSREFAGDNPLDNTIGVASLKGIFPLGWSLNAQTDLLYSPRLYTDQTVVVESGLLSATKREDELASAGLSLNRPFRTSETTNLVTGINYAYSQLNSNQNHYDAQFTQYVSNYYAYAEQRVAGYLSFAFGKTSVGPMVIDSGYSYSRRDYTDRVIQAADGTYGTELLYITETQFTAGFSYPLAKNLRLQFTTSVGKSISNNDYEQVYVYNYDNANFLFGFTYDY